MNSQHGPFPQVKKAADERGDYKIIIAIIRVYLYTPLATSA